MDIIHSYKNITFMDGDMWCAVKQDYINVQESIIGFGKTEIGAIKNLFNIEYPFGQQLLFSFMYEE